MNAPTNIETEVKDTFDLVEHIKKQKQWSEETFGPGMRTDGVTDHIAKELEKIKEKPADLYEWVDVILLAIDGAWRAGYTPEQVSAVIEQKLKINMSRSWPDWREADKNKAIEHVRP